MALEPITRQEQIIAGKDLEPITRMEKFLKEYGGGGGGGASHWNELEGKPFVTVGGDTLEWDGNTEGLMSVDPGTGSFYHVCDSVPTYDDIPESGYTKTVVVDGEVFESTGAKSNWTEIAPDTGIIFDAAFLVVPEKSAGMALEDLGGFVFPKAGVYFAETARSLTIPGYTGFTKEQIDPAVLPDALQFGDKMTEIMPETELTGIDQNGIYLLFLESFPEADECHVTFDGVKYTCKKISLDGDIAYGNLSILGAGDDTGEPFILCMGCAIVNDDAPHTVGISEMRATPIDEKYIPPRKTFYVKYNDASDIYLYTDEEKTTKATMEDVKAADEMHGIRIETGLGMWATPLIVKTGVSSGNGAHDYAMVGVVKTLNGDTATFAFYYTDKYTAS